MKKLSDEAVINALITSKNYEECANTLGCTTMTIYRKMQNPQFLDKYHKRQSDNFELVNSQITSATVDAIQFLHSAILRDDIANGVKVNACRCILDYQLKSNEQLVILRELSEVKQQLQKLKC